MKIVIHPPVDKSRLQALRAVAGDVVLINAVDPATAEREIVDADALLGKLTPAMLAAAQNLRWVQAFTVSLEHYVFPELVTHPCTLTNMRGLFSDIIADQVLGYLLCFARNLHVYIRQQAEGRWAPCGGEGERSDFSAGPGAVSAIDRAHRHLGDMTLGIVGLGHIGRELARRAAAFGMRIVAIDPAIQSCPAEVTELRPADQLPWLLEQSEFVVICAPHTPTTAGLFGRAQFRQMRRDGYLINIGRGAIVRLDDLCDALEAGELAGAALDVFEQEPLPPDHRLWRMPNVILTPHIAGFGIHVAERHLQVLVDNVRRFVHGEPLANVVDKSQWF